MTERDLHEVLGVLQDVEPAPPELVERVWRDVESLLAGGATGPDRDPTTEVVTIEDFDQRPPSHRNLRRSGMWLAVAAAIVLVVFALRSPDDDPSDVAIDPTPGSDDSMAAADTIEEACTAFRATIAGTSPFTGDPLVDIGAAAEIWVGALGQLIDDVERIGLPDSPSDQTLTLQLLRTALRSSENSTAAGDPKGAATALDNAERHRDGMRDKRTPLSTCFAAE